MNEYTHTLKHTIKPSACQGHASSNIWVYAFYVIIIFDRMVMMMNEPKTRSKKQQTHISTHH